MSTMKAVVFRGKGRLGLELVPRPTPGPGEAVIRITTTTICGTDVHIVRGEYPVAPGLVLGHEPVGVIDALGPGLDDLYAVGQRVIAGAITPCGQCFFCLNGASSQCGGAVGGWRLRPHDQRRVGRVPAGARRAREPRADSAGPDRRGRAAVSGRLLDRAGGRRERRHPRRRHGRRVRAGADRALRHARREADRRGPDHRGRQGARAARTGAALRRHHHAQPRGRAIRSPKSGG